MVALKGQMMKVAAALEEAIVVKEEKEPTHREKEEIINYKALVKTGAFFIAITAFICYFVKTDYHLPLRLFWVRHNSY